jgi:hypothetical protein
MLVTDKPEELKPQNDLDDIVDPDAPPPDAYLALGTTPAALRNPPAVGEKRTYIVRVECTGERKKKRDDGEMRYTRDMNVLWAVPEGTEKPADPEPKHPKKTKADQDAEAAAEAAKNQAPLIDEDGSVNPDAVDDEDQDDEGSDE